jgi:hypothetical protein
LGGHENQDFVYKNQDFKDLASSVTIYKIICGLVWCDICYLNKPESVLSLSIRSYLNDEGGKHSPEGSN